MWLPLLGGVIDKLVPDVNANKEMKHQLAVMEQQGELKELEIAMSAIVAEAKSSDKWTSRARPGFLYVMYIYLLMAIPFGIIAMAFPENAKAAMEGMKMWFDAIPGNMYALFGAGYLGYSGFRSVDKAKQTKANAEGGISSIVESARTIMATRR